MRLHKLLTLASLSMACILFIIGCKSGNDPSLTTENQGKLVVWEYQPFITEPIQATSNQQAVTLADPQNWVNLNVPGKSFDTATQLTLKNPKSVPNVWSHEFTPIGAPVEISGAETRLNQPAVLTFRVDKDKYAADLKDGSIWVTYYDGKKWEYFPPHTTDAITGTITFKTYHFSFFGAGKISVEERISKYAHSKTLGELAQEKVDDIVNEMVKNSVEYILKKRLGLDDDAAEKSIKFKIMSSLANDDDYRDIIDKFREGDATGVSEKFQLFVGKKIAENLEESMWKSSLEFLSDSGTDLLKAGSQAAGYAAEGQYLEAGRILGTQIAEKFMITKIIESGVEIVQYNIDTWKDAEVEGAFQAFKNGSDDKFFGYNVDAGDFDALWNQMRGIATRLESEAVERETVRREEYGLPPPTEKDLDAVRAKVRDDLKKQFEDRLKNEGEIEKQEARIKTLIKKFQESRMLEKGTYGYDENFYDMESRLDQLFHLTKKILRDTGRSNWNTTAFTNEKEICVGDMIALMKAWYSTNGREEYAKMLKERFKIGVEDNTGIKRNFRLIPVFTALELKNINNKLIYDASPIEVLNGAFSAKSNLTDYEYESFGMDEPMHYDTAYLTMSGTYDPVTCQLKGTMQMGDYQRQSNMLLDQAYNLNIQATIRNSDEIVTLHLSGEYKEFMKEKVLDTRTREMVWHQGNHKNNTINNWDVQFKVEIIE